MAEEQGKDTNFSRKKAVLISGGILLIAAGIVAFLFWKAQKQDTQTVEDIEVTEIKLRDVPVLFAPDSYEASQEEIDDYEKLLRDSMVSTDTLYIENDCVTSPIVINFTDAEELRIINDSNTSHTLKFAFNEYTVPGDGLEFIDIVNDGIEGRNYYFCDDILSGIIILEKT